MAPFEQQRPCIHVGFLPGADQSLYRWVQIGSEEEGVPCRLVSEAADNPVALAYAAAQSSRFNIGVGVSDTAVVLHETHMPPEQPVLAFSLSDQAEYFSRLMGSNAARMIVRRPFRFEDEPAPFYDGNDTQTEAPQVAGNDEQPIRAACEEKVPSDLEVDPAQVVELVTLIVQKLQERGVR